MAARFPRIEALLGTALELVSEEDLRRLVDGDIVEDADLEYKAEPYGRSDSAKRDLAGDVAALASTAGGLIIIGVSESPDGRAASLLPAALESDVVVWIHQVVASHVSPAPAIEPRVVLSEDNAGRSYCLITVPLSRVRPHGVRVGDGFRFPVRDGPRIRYLSEPELADMYADRFRTERAQLDRLDVVEAEGVDMLAGNGSWLTLSVTPDAPGHLPIDQAAVNELRSWATAFSSDVPFEALFPSPPSASAGVRRISLAGNYADGRAESGCADFHQDGSVFLAQQLGREGWPAEFPAVPDENLVLSCSAMLAWVGDHAHRRVGMAGDALARANVVVPMDDRGVRLVHFRGFGGWERAQEWALGRSLKRPIRFTHTLRIEALAQPRDRLLTTRMLLTDVFQAFGVAEVPQITLDGKLRRRYFNSHRHQAIARWAEESGLELVDTTLATD